MNFSPNETHVEVIKEGAFGVTYFRDIYSSVNGEWYKNSWKEFGFLKDMILGCIHLIFMMLGLINMV